MIAFENPANGYCEGLHHRAAFWGTLLLGPLYLAYKGIWGQAVLLFSINLVLLAVLGPFGVVGMLVADLLWAFRVEELISRDYLRRGWKRVV